MTDKQNPIPPIGGFNTPPEVQQAAVKTKSFYQENKDAINVVVFIGVVYLVHKRMVTKAIRKDTLIVKEHLRNVTLGLEDLSEMLGMRPTEAWHAAVEDLVGKR